MDSDARLSFVDGLHQSTKQWPIGIHLVVQSLYYNNAEIKLRQVLLVFPNRGQS